VRAAGRSRRAWGWHPLTDPWAARIVADAGIRPGQLVVDIGAGDGALTRHLVAAGASVLAVELHPGRAEQLRTRFAAEDVTVVAVDVAAFRWPRRPFRVVASPPFARSSDVLRGLLAPGSRLVAADLVLQRAVMRKYVEGRAPGAGRWLRHWDVLPGRSLPRSAFRPPPQVDSSVLVVRKR
jgi:23S rRNA (adenine-N6)-dimethyltransferase